MPYGLWGELVLHDASCQKCAFITGNEIEQPILTKELDFLRQALNAPSRKKRVRKKYAKVNGNAIELDRQDMPLACCFHVTNEPELLHDVALLNVSRVKIVSSTIINPEKLLKHSDGISPVGFQTEILNDNTFWRFVAKICLSYFRYYFSEKYDTSELQRIVLGIDKNPHSRVGCVDSIEKDRDSFWSIGFAIAKSVSGRPYLSVVFQLLGCFDGPNYCVIIGEDGEHFDSIRNVPRSVKLISFI